MILTVVLVVALVLRVLLDVVGIVQPNWRIDAAYALLFTVIAGAMLLREPSGWLGYAAAIIACLSAVTAMRAGGR